MKSFFDIDAISSSKDERWPSKNLSNMNYGIYQI